MFISLIMLVTAVLIFDLPILIAYSFFSPRKLLNNHLLMMGITAPEGGIIVGGGRIGKLLWVTALLNKNTSCFPLRL